MDNEAFLPQEKLLIPVAGGSLAVFRYGRPVGEPVLLIHGITSSNRAFQLLANALVARGRSPYAVDLRGRGDSSSLPGPFGMAVHARDMLAVCDYLGWDKVDVIGHSMGAFVSVYLNGLSPERVRRAVLIDGGIPLPMPHETTVEQLMPAILGPALARLAMTFESKAAYRDYWKPQPAFVKGWSTSLDEYVDYDLRDGRPSTNPQAVEEDSRDLFGDDLIVGALQNLRDDVLFVKAERGLQNEPGGLYPMPVLEAVLPQYPKLKLMYLDDTNHYDMILEGSGAERIAQAIYGRRQ